MSLSKINKYVIKSKIICKYFISGKCIKGEKCPYLHSQIDKPKDSEIECPMYRIGYCKNGPVCQFAHIKKNKYLEDEIIDKKEEIHEQKEEINNKIEEDEDATSSTPLAEDFIESENEKNNNKNKNKNENNNNNLITNSQKQTKDKKEYNNDETNNEDKEDNIIFHEIPIWYLEHYYDKPISMIFTELENQNLPEIIALQEKYGLIDIKQDLSMMNPMNTLNLNFNNFNMNFDLNNNFQNFPLLNQNYPDFSSDPNYDNYRINIDNIEYIINKDINIYYYLIKCKNYKQVKKSYESNIIKLPEKLFDKYKYIDLSINDLTIIIIIYNKEYNDFAGFAKLLYPLNNENNDNLSEIEDKNKNLYQIEWLWKNKMPFSEVSHLMNRADDDHFLNEGKNGCPIDKDLGNYICRLMIKRLTQEEIFELIYEKQIFNDQIKYNRYLKHLKKYKYDYEYYDYGYNDEDYYNHDSVSDMNNYYDDNDNDNDNYDKDNDNVNDNDYDKKILNKKYKENSQNKYKYDDEYYYLKKNHKSHKKSEYKYESNEIKHKRKKRKKYRKSRSRSLSRSLSRGRNRSRSRSRSRNRSRNRSYDFSENDNKRHYRRKNSEEYYNSKHRRNKENIKKIYSQVNEEYIQAN